MQLCKARLCNSSRADSEQTVQSIRGAAENHPNSLLLEAEKYSEGRHIPEASL